MWRPIWPGTPADGLPVRVAHEWRPRANVDVGGDRDLLEKYLSDQTGSEHHDDPALCDAVLDIPDEELWAARQSLREFLFNFIRERARYRWTTEGIAAARIVAAGTMFDHNVPDDRLRAPFHRI